MVKLLFGKTVKYYSDIWWRMSKAARHWSESESKDNVKCNQNSKAYLL